MSETVEVSVHQVAPAEPIVWKHDEETILLDEVEKILLRAFSYKLKLKSGPVATHVKCMYEIWAEEALDRVPAEHVSKFVRKCALVRHQLALLGYKIEV